MIGIGYQICIPVTPEDFADPAQRNTWRAEKNMTVLKLYSDAHRRTPIDVFVYEPFDFAREYARATWEVIGSDVKVPFIAYDSLLAMKRNAGRSQDLADISNLEEAKRLRGRKP